MRLGDRIGALRGLGQAIGPQLQPHFRDDVRVQFVSCPGGPTTCTQVDESAYLFIHPSAGAPFEHRWAIWNQFGYPQRHHDQGKVQELINEVSGAFDDVVRIKQLLATLKAIRDTLTAQQQGVLDTADADTSIVLAEWDNADFIPNPKIGAQRQGIYSMDTGSPLYAQAQEAFGNWRNAVREILSKISGARLFLEDFAQQVLGANVPPVAGKKISPLVVGGAAAALLLLATDMF